MKDRLLATPLARLGALPGRLRWVSAHLGHQLRLSIGWLWRSREHTNFTYDLDTLNLEHLCWFVAGVVDVPVAQVRGYVRELLEDPALAEHVRTRTRNAGRRYLSDEVVRYGRRLGWYAIVRARRPGLVVETGTDKGLGSCVLAAALLRNGHGRLVTIDINPASGFLIGPPYDAVVDRRIGDSVVELAALDAPVDLFLHDSLHSRAHELAELAGVTLSDTAIALSDNAHATDALPEWAERTGRRFAFFAERPADHWYPGAGIGAAWR